METRRETGVSSGSTIPDKIRVSKHALRLLRNLPAYERKLEGWTEIRAWFKQLGTCLPHGPNRWTMRRWRQKEGLPVVQGTGRRPPWTTTALIVAWLIARAEQGAGQKRKGGADGQVTAIR